MPPWVVIIKSHTYNACATKIQSLQDIRDTLDILLRSDTYSNTDHLPYAFRFQDANGEQIENFNSDGDNGAGIQILKTLKSKNVNNLVIFATHSNSESYLSAKQKNDSLSKVTSGALLALNNLMEESMSNM